MKFSFDDNYFQMACNTPSTSNTTYLELIEVASFFYSFILLTISIIVWELKTVSTERLSSKCKSKVTKNMLIAW